MILLKPEYWKVINTPHKQRAVIAQKDIPAGTVIGDYLGKVVRPEEENYGHQGGIYGLNWHEDYTYLPNKNEPNHILLINHSCAPNCGMYPYQGHILYASIRKIFAGEELTVSYMIEPDSRDQSPHFCHCGELFCKGTMYSGKKHSTIFWEKFIIPEQEKYLNSIPAYGNDLTPLQNYPEFIPDNSIWDLFGNTKIAPEIINTSDISDHNYFRNLIRNTGKTLSMKDTNNIIIGTTFPNTFYIRKN